MKLKSLLSTAALFLAASMLGGCAGGNASSGDSGDSAATSAAESSEPDADAEADIKAMTSLDMIRAMGNGINLGNTLEAYNHNGYLAGADPDGFETGWGQPYTTAEMMQGIKNAGVDT